MNPKLPLNRLLPDAYDPDEYDAVMRQKDGAGLLDRSWRAALQLRGRDRQTFLQGMVSNDVAALTPGQGCRAALLDTTAHLLADLIVHCLPEMLLLETDPQCVERVAQTLDKFLIMEKVEITAVSGDWAILSVQGSGASALLSSVFSEASFDALPALHHSAIRLPDGVMGWAAAFSHSSAPGYDLWLPASSAPAVLERLLAAGAVPISPETAEILRVEAGIAVWGQELSDAILLPEAGLTDAVSYQKGCYVGQEIVARLHARGHTNRSLRGVLLPDDTPLPLPGDTLHALPDSGAAGREIGRITSAVHAPRFEGRPLALAYVRNEYTAAGTKLEVRAMTPSDTIFTEGMVLTLP